MMDDLVIMAIGLLVLFILVNAWIIVALTERVTQ